jgi:hypothetical protein
VGTVAFIEMTCKCEASFQADLNNDNNESLVVMWANQFVVAHAECGFMSGIKKDKPEHHRVIDWDTDVKYKESNKKDIE